MEKETDTECSGYWQPVDRETERVITRGQLDGNTEAGLSEQGTEGWAYTEKHEQGRVGLHASCVVRTTKWKKEQQ